METSSRSEPEGKEIPTGYVLGPDGKPCKICTGFKVWSHNMGKSQPGSKKSSMVEVSKTNIESSNALSSLDEGKRGSSGLRKDCPADVERLGRHTWTFLHTTASYYPTSPNETQQRSMLQLLKALPVLYPCRNCAEDLELEISRRPPDVSSREKLEQWMCRTHNEVNRRLGKDEFDCSMVAQRWRDGWKDGRCDE